MHKVIYVDLDAVLLMIEVIGDYPHQMLGKYIPNIDQYWIENVGSSIERAYFVCSSQGLDKYEVASRIFYNIAKGHFTGDGNKRSALICTYVFLMFNNLFIADPNMVYAFARRVARSKGSRKSAFWLRECAKFFKKNSSEIQ